MQTKFLLMLFFTFSVSNAQNIFEYEREIINRDAYISQEIEFENTDEKIKLSGTLITPQSGFEKIIIIVPGSGKDTRFTHPKLTEKLLGDNIAVYRFDERGLGKSDGVYSRNVSTLKNDLNHCIKHLKRIKNIKNKKIGVLGHSLGGMASIGIMKFDPQLDFLIQMSTPVDAGDSFKNRISKMDVFKNRDKSIQEIEKLIDTFNVIIRSEDNISLAKKKCEKARRKLNFSKEYSRIYLSPQIIDIVNLNTEFLYRKNDKPLLYIIGKNDELVDVENSIKKIKLIKNKFISIEVLENMDHYLTKNSGKWNNSKGSEAREISDLAYNRIIKWIKSI